MPEIAEAHNALLGARLDDPQWTKVSSLETPEPVDRSPRSYCNAAEAELARRHVARECCSCEL